MFNDLVSIIVPVYNVSQFIDCCIKSIINQSYTCIEVILVDDGSTDGSGERCDYWSSVDSRIRVIHKKNGGLSSARNTGLQLSSGKYIYFIDSDDWIHSSLVSTCVERLMEDNTDIVFFKYRYASLDGSSTEISRDSPHFPNEVVMSCGQALSALWNENIPNYSWSFLADRHVYNHVLFPEGKLMEDLATTYRLIVNADSVSFVSCELYFYRIRPGSILDNPRPKLVLDNYEHIVHIDSFANSFPYDLFSVERNWSIKYMTGDLIRAYKMRSLFDPDMYNSYFNDVMQTISQHINELGFFKLTLTNQLKIILIYLKMMPFLLLISDVRNNNRKLFGRRA